MIPIPDIYARTFVGRISAVENYFPLVEGSVIVQYRAQQTAQGVWRPFRVTGTFVGVNRIFPLGEQFNVIFAIQVGVDPILFRAVQCRVPVGHPDFVAADLQVPGGPDGWTAFIPTILPTPESVGLPGPFPSLPPTWTS